MSGIATKINLPGPLRAIGKKHVEQAVQWKSLTAFYLKNRIPSAAAFGSTGFGLLLYFTDWKAVLQYVPYYNIAFKEEK